MAGKLSAIGRWVLPWPESAGARMTRAAAGRGASRAQPGAGRKLWAREERQGERAKATQASAAQPQIEPNLVSSVSRRIVLFSASKPEMPAASAPSTTIPATPPQRRAGPRRAAPCAGASEGARRPRPLLPRAGDRRKPRQPDRAAGRGRPRRPAPSPRTQRAGEAEDRLGHRAAARALGEFGDGLLRRHAGLADREDEAAGDDVAVGGDHPVGGGVAAVGQAGLEVDAEPRAFAVGVEGVALVDPRAFGVEDADRAEVALDRLVEAEDHRGGLVLDDGAALGLVPSSWAWASAAAGGQQGQASSRRSPPAAAHRPTRPPSPARRRRLAGPLRPPRSRRRRTTRTSAPPPSRITMPIRMKGSFEGLGLPTQ